MSTSPDSPRNLINADGGSFASGRAELEVLLAALSNDDRVAYRDANATAIAQHDAPLLLVVAGPGSGKSFLFLDRIRYWLSQEDDPQIYVSSFVRKLVNDLQNEIATQIDEGGQNVSATTLHTLARSLIERNRGGGELRMRQNIKIISARWEGMVWEDVLAFHPDLPGTHSLGDLKAQFQDDVPSEEAEWADLRATYDTLRQFYNAVGFGDMIVTARLAVEENPELIEHSFWIIDEFQDFNTAEEHLIRAVTREATAVLIAGDDEQALYQRLKGSHPEIIVSYYDNPDVANAMLPYCSRCSYYVCLAASSFIDRNRGENAIAKIYLPLTEDPEAPKVQVVAAAAPTSAVDYVRGFLEDHRQELEDHLAAMKAGDETDPFLLILTPEKRVRFYKLREADDELRELVAEWSDPALSHSVDYWKVADFCATAWDPSGNFALRKVLDYESVPVPTVHDLLVEAIENATTLAAVDSEVIANALEKCRAIAAIVESDELTAPEKAKQCGEVVPITDHERLASELEADPISSTTDEGEEAIETGGGGSPVELLTIVGAKGLSAKHVVVLGCDDVNLAHTTPLGFYVALTRARESLHLITAAKAGGAKAPHQFLLDLPEECCEFVVHKKSGSPELLDGHGAFQDRLATWGRFARRGASR